MKNFPQQYPEDPKILEIQEYCWFSLQQTFDKDLSQHDFLIQENLYEWPLMSYQEFIDTYDFNIDDFDALNSDNVWEDVLQEIYKTYWFLVGAFSDSLDDLKNVGIQLWDLVDATIFRLKEQILEAGWPDSKRKLKNGTVVWLANYKDDTFVLRKIPYFAFACTNVSLDAVRVMNSSWEMMSLRQIDTLLQSKNKNGNYFLPNSLGVSVCMGAKDDDGNHIFIAQERNNAAVLSQNANKYIASASGGIPLDMLQWENLFREAINSEIEEELWIIANPVHANRLIEHILKRSKNVMEEKLDNIYKVKEGMSDILSKKLEKMWIQWGVLPVALVMEEARRNPEIIFIANTDHALSEIQKSWKDAKGKDEALSIWGFSVQEIEADIIRRKERKQPKIDNHFFMSYFGYMLAFDRYAHTIGTPTSSHF